MPFYCTYNEFAAKHGNDAIRIAPSLLLFSDGARVNDADGRFAYYEPQAEEDALAWQLKYARAKLERATDNFNRAKHDMMEQAQLASRYANLPGPPENATDILEKLKAEAVLWREKVANLEAQNENTAEAQRQAAIAKHTQERMSQAARLGAAVQSVSLD